MITHHEITFIENIGLLIVYASLAVKEFTWLIRGSIQTASSALYSANCGSRGHTRGRRHASEIIVKIADQQTQTAVTAFFSNKQLLLIFFAGVVFNANNNNSITDYFSLKLDFQLTVTAVTGFERAEFHAKPSSCIHYNDKEQLLLLAYCM